MYLQLLIFEQCVGLINVSLSSVHCKHFSQDFLVVFLGILHEVVEQQGLKSDRPWLYGKNSIFLKMSKKGQILTENNFF